MDCAHESVISDLHVTTICPCFTLAKETAIIMRVNFVMYACRFACKNSRYTEDIFTKYYIGELPKRL